MTPTSLDIQSLHEAYAIGRLAPVEVIRQIYAKVEANGDDSVWIHLLPESEVLARASSLGEYDSRLPLFGVPFAVKDNIDVATLPTTAACPEYAYVAEATATVVQLLLDAGAILIGKTNLDQFATGLVGTRSPYGASSCVFNRKYISGGSSSGSAVAVASGLVSFALGTDTAGSGRVPAAFNNLVGWKPTRGLVSTLGIVPACRSLDCPSVFTLTGHDALRVARVISVHDEADPYSRENPGSPPDLPAAFTFGVPSNEELQFFDDAEAKKLFQQAVQRLTSIGGTPVEIDYAPFRKAADLLYSGPWVAERLAAVTPFIDRNPRAFHPTTLKIIEGGRRYTAVDTFRDFYRLEALRRQASKEWKAMDILLLPTTGTIYTHEEVATDPVALNTNLGFYTNFVNLLDLSGIALPAGFRPNGLPFGVTLLGRAFLDNALFSIATRYQTALGGRLGATATTVEKLSASVPVSPSSPHSHYIPLAVVGAHLKGEPLNPQLLDLGAVFDRTTVTAPGYRLYALPNTSPPKPGLVRDPDADGPGIEVEIWQLTPEAFGRFTASVTAPLSIGTIQLANSHEVHGFLCESFAVTRAQEITEYGGWRGFLRETSANASM